MKNNFYLEKYRYAHFDIHGLKTTEAAKSTAYGKGR